MNMKRMRGRNHRPNGGGGNSGGGFRNQQNGIPLNRNHVFDSSGPEMRVRGTAQQLYEKYQQLGRDASSNGDRVTGEAYYQHAEHYFRIISAINQAQGIPAQPNPQQGHTQQGHSQGGHPQQGQHNQNGQPSYQNNQAPQGQDRNGGNLRDSEPQNGQQNGHYNNNGNNYQNRRFEPNNGDRRPEPRTEQQDLQFSDAGPQETRPNENRQNENRPYEPRRNEQRDRQDFQRNGRNAERQERPERQERQREVPAVDPRIDISSALEAELAAAVAEPLAPAEPPVLEARSIPIIPDAPPPAEAPARATPAQVDEVAAAVAEAPAPTAENVAEPAKPARVAKPRGRPRAKPAPTE